MHRLTRTAALAALLLTAWLPVALLASCAPRQAPARPLTVAAASDLQLAFAELGELFTANTGRQVVFTFGSTGNLARQIENGAPVDLFAAANVAYVRELTARGHLLAETERLYAVGRIVLAVNKASGLTLNSLADLLDPRIRSVAIANPEHAPYGQAARQALISAGLWERVHPKLVYGENVRQALQFVQTGNAEAGIIALSIAEAPGLAWHLIDDRLHEPLVQALAVVARSPNRQAAEEFAAFVMGPDGQPVMQRYGFLLPNGR